jgi:MYXO-CTERM domain-containing protein
MNHCRGLLISMLLSVLCGLPAQLQAGTTTHQYDEVGRLVQVNYENGNSISYAYDDAGNMVERMVIGSDAGGDVYGGDLGGADVMSEDYSDGNSHCMEIGTDTVAGSDSKIDGSGGQGDSSGGGSGRSKGCSYSAAEAQPLSGGGVLILLLLAFAWRMVSRRRRAGGLI